MHGVFYPRKPKAVGNKQPEVRESADQDLLRWQHQTGQLITVIVIIITNRHWGGACLLLLPTTGYMQLCQEEQEGGSPQPQRKLGRK